MIRLTDEFLQELADAKLEEFGPETAGLLRNLAASLLISREISRTFLTDLMKYEDALNRIIGFYGPGLDGSPEELASFIARNALGK